MTQANLWINIADQLSTWERRCANNAQTIDAQSDFRSEVREGWIRYIKSTCGESVEEWSAVNDTETLVVSDDGEAPAARK